MDGARPPANWAGNVVFGAARFHRPRSVAELQAIVAASRRIRVLGSGHSFNRIADTDGDLVSLADLPPVVRIAPDRRSVTVSGGMRYGEVARALEAEGLALHNLGSLPHIGIAGACATGTHGSGDGNRVLAGAVRGMRLVTASGDLVELAGEELRGAAVGLGLLGAVVEVTLAVEPSYLVAQRVYEDLPAEAVAAHLDALLGLGYSVSLFTTWRRPAVIDQVWVKARLTAGAAPDGVAPDGATPDGAAPDGATPDGGATPVDFGAVPADGPRHPLAGLPTRFTTEQLGVPGPWHERLPHFRLEFTPSAGEELQSEYLVPREHAADAIAALAGAADRFAHLVQVSEVRSVAADDLWLSPASGRDAVGLHTTWVKDEAAVTAVLPALEAVLEPFGARPHWGKLFTVTPRRVRALYPLWSSFAELASRWDPQGVFRNAMLTPYFEE